MNDQGKTNEVYILSGPSGNFIIFIENNGLQMKISPKHIPNILPITHAGLGSTLSTHLVTVSLLFVLLLKAFSTIVQSYVWIFSFIFPAETDKNLNF